MRRLHFGRLALGGNARAFPFSAERRLRGAPPCLELRERELGGLAAPFQLVRGFTRRGALALELFHPGMQRFGLCVEAGLLGTLAFELRFPLRECRLRRSALAVELFHPGMEAFDLCVQLRLFGTMALLRCLALLGAA